MPNETEADLLRKELKEERERLGLLRCIIKTLLLNGAPMEMDVVVRAALKSVGIYL